MLTTGIPQHITQYSDLAVIEKVFAAAKVAEIEIATLQFHPSMADRRRSIIPPELKEIAQPRFFDSFRRSEETNQTDSGTALDTLTLLVRSGKVRIKEFKFEFSHNLPGSVEIKRSKTASGLDELVMQAGQNLTDEAIERLTVFSEELEKQITFRSTSDLLEKIHGEELKHHSNAREETLSRIESVMTDLVYKLAEARRVQEEDLSQMTARELERVKAEEIRSLNEIQLERARFEKDQSEAEEKLKGRESIIDIRDSKIVRRDIRITMQKLIAARLRGELLDIHTPSEGSVSGGSSASTKRNPGELGVKLATFMNGILGVHGMSLALLSLFGAGFWWSSLSNTWNASTSDTANETAKTPAASASPATNWDRIFSIYGPRLFFTMGFSVTATFYLRLLNHDYQKRNKEEARLRRLALDIDRASWVVESALEWKAETQNEPLPTELTQVLAKGLFENAEGPEEATHPAESAERILFGSWSRAKLNLPNGNQVELDRKSNKK